jgi:hypothetical protein
MMMNINIFSTTKRKIGVKHGTANSFRVGDRVQSPNYGKGVVRAYNPNGALIVRFDGQKKSQSVFPTFLDQTVN